MRTDTRNDMQPYQRIYKVVCQIPHGRVATYGQIAAICGLGTARTVGYAMAALFEDDVPWQRVINAQGRVSARVGGEEDKEQRKYLMDEGVVFDRLGRVDFRIFGWEGPDMDWLERNGCFPAVSPRTRGK